MEPPWILVLCHEFPPLGGGAGKNLYLLCRELTRRGVKVRVWTGDPGPGKRWAHGFEVDYIPMGRKARFETSLRGMLEFSFRAAIHRRLGGAAGRVARRKPALVLSNLGIPAGLAGDILSRRFGAPHAVWYQGSDVHAGRPDGCGAFQKSLLRFIWARASINFFVSPSLRDMALTMGKPKRPRIMPTCPSLEILAAPTGGGLPPDERYYLFLGRFDPVKNPMVLVDALARLKASGRAIRPFRLVGSGGMEEEVRQALAAKGLDRIAVMLPAVPFEGIPEAMVSAYALVLPSRIEGFNTTAMEAAHFGVPSIASDTVGLRDFVKHERNGLLFREGDAESLADALASLASRPADRDALGVQAKADALAYRPDRVADGFLAALAELSDLVPLFHLAPSHPPVATREADSLGAAPLGAAA